MDIIGVELLKYSGLFLKKNYYIYLKDLVIKLDT
jgi:hypothetical protein